jgi:ribosomal protein S2
MKIYKTSTKNYNSLRLKLFKNHIYIDKTIEMLPRLKKALNIIFKYHTGNKRILFVGYPNKKFIYVLKRTKHIFIPQSIWIEGILTNPKSFFKGLTQKSIKISRQNFSTFAELNKTIDLIVILNENLNTKITEEAYKAQIPTIVYNCDLNIFNTKPNFKVPNNNKKTTNNFFYSILMAIIFKILKIKYQKKIKNLNLLPAKYFKGIKKLF